MSKDIARNVALVTYGNLYLQDRGKEFDIGKLATDNCYRLDFMDRPLKGISGSTKLFASDAHKWFTYLKDQSAKKLKLHYRTSSQTDLPDYINTAFIGGGSHWLVEVQFETSSDLYLSEWTPSEDVGLDRMKTHYVRLDHDVTHLDDSSLSVSKSREELSTVLEDLCEFAGRFDYTQHWVENFNNSKKMMKEFEPQSSDEFLPSGIFSKEARQLIAGAFASWVFGGMGSWNDLAFSGEYQEQYTSLSEELYSALCQAIVSGVNSYP